MMENIFHVITNRHSLFEYGNGFIVTELVFIVLIFFIPQIVGAGEDLNGLLQKAVNY